MKVYLYSAFTFIIGVVGHKNNHDARQVCHIIRMTSDAGDTIDFLYDTIGRVQSIKEVNGHVSQFNYYENTIIATETDKGAISYKRIMTIGCNGMMSNLFEEKHGEGAPSWTSISYSYIDIQLRSTTTFFSYDAAPIQADLTWQEGNLISESSNDVKRELNEGNQYEYYTDKLMQPGGYWYINLLSTLGWGQGLYSNKNLLKSIRSANSTTLIAYEFDKEGKIISMIKSNNGNRKAWYYEYACM